MNVVVIIIFFPPLKLLPLVSVWPPRKLKFLCRIGVVHLKPGIEFEYKYSAEE